MKIARLRRQQIKYGHFLMSVDKLISFTVVDFVRCFSGTAHALVIPFSKIMLSFLFP